MIDRQLSVENTEKVFQDPTVVSEMEMTALPFTSPLLPCAECPDKERHSCLPVRLQVIAEGSKAGEEKKGSKKEEERKRRRKRKERNRTRPDWATLPDLLLIKIFKYLSIEVRSRKEMYCQRYGRGTNCIQDKIILDFQIQERHYAALACRWWNAAFR